MQPSFMDDRYETHHNSSTDWLTSISREKYSSSILDLVPKKSSTYYRNHFKLHNLWPAAQTWASFSFGPSSGHHPVYITRLANTAIITTVMYHCWESWSLTGPGHRWGQVPRGGVDIYTDWWCSDRKLTDSDIFPKLPKPNMMSWKNSSLLLYLINFRLNNNLQHQPDLRQIH